MAIKKSQIYSTLWNSCDALRGSMDASQYKDYVLMILFIKYLSDKESDEDSIFTIPDGCRFSDFVLLKGDDHIGEQINKKLEAIKEANAMFLNRLALPNFNDPSKLGKPKEMRETLSNLIAAFESEDLDFSKNRTADDDILGDAYEYLMKNFAAESGKSKGQFYTPAEVSRVMAKMLHLTEFTSPSTTIYDPTCGSGSLLLRAIGETPNGATPYGQEKDNSTASLAILNMLLHGVDTATIEQGDTINSPEFTEGGQLKTFDVCVANPPFSTKSWLGAAGKDDAIYHRWTAELCPPDKCGDYAFLLHLIASMKPGTGRGACILPHGVLFRGNAEYEIRKHIIRQGWIEGIVGLPANIFFGTGIPASIILINKQGAADRKGIFFIDAKDGFVKDGNKNRLREQDIKRIVDTWNARCDVPHYAKFVPISGENSIEANDYNLNIPRYIQPADIEIRQDIDAHLHGGIPKHDVEQLSVYWAVCPSLRSMLFDEMVERITLRTDKAMIADAVAADHSFIEQKNHFSRSIEAWCDKMRPLFRGLTMNIKPKALIEEWAQSLLDIMKEDKSLVVAYDAYQQLLTYWLDTLQDDCYIISRDGWKPTLLRGTKKTVIYEDMVCDLLPISIVLNEYFADELEEIAVITADRDEVAAELQTMIDAAIEEAAEDDEDENKALTDEVKKTKEYKAKDKVRKAIDKKLKEKKAALTEAVAAKYAAFTETEVIDLVVEKKWIATITAMIQSEMQQVTQRLTADITVIVERYEQTLSVIDTDVADLEAKVNSHLAKMGFSL